MQLNEEKKEVPSRSTYLTPKQERMLVILQLHPSILDASELLLAGSNATKAFNECKKLCDLLKDNNTDKEEITNVFNLHGGWLGHYLADFRLLNKKIFQYVPKEQEEYIPSWQEIAQLEQILAVREGTSPIMLKLSYLEIKEVFDSIHAMLQQY